MLVEAIIAAAVMGVATLGFAVLSDRIGPPVALHRRRDRVDALGVPAVLADQTRGSRS